MTKTEMEVAIAVLQQALIGKNEALALQAKEYERRLDELRTSHRYQAVIAVIALMGSLAAMFVRR